MYTFTYLRLFTSALESIQSKIVVTMRKAKIKQSPPLSDAANVHAKVLKIFNRGWKKYECCPQEQQDN